MRPRVAPHQPVFHAPRLLLQPFSNGFQAIHRHPRTVRAATAGRPLASRGRFKQFFFRHRLLHFVEDAAIGRHDKLSVRQRFCRLNKLTGGAHRIGHLDNGLRRFRVNQKSGIGIDFFKRVNAWVLNSSCTIHAPCQHSTSAPVCFCT